MKKIVFAATMAVTAGLALPAAASAQSYDIRTGYGSSVFEYGSGTGGGGFTAFSTSYAGGCFGQVQVACMSDSSNATVPTAAVNNGTMTVNFATTVDLPNNVLMLHPGFGSNSDAILRFVAPTTGAYNLSGIFSRLDNVNGGGDGVNVSIFNAAGGLLFSSALANTPQGVSVNFGTLSTFLNTGEAISFVVNNGNGPQPEGTYYDSTGLSGTITAVPEPASWALMIVGFGFAGYAMRRRRATVAFA